MGNRRLKKLDALGTKIQSKTIIRGEPNNRAEKRRFKHILKRENVSENEIDKDALFKALKDKNVQ